VVGISMGGTVAEVATLADLERDADRDLQDLSGPARRPGDL
jgi:hypothetical protein